MFADPLTIIVAVACLVVLIILMIGIGSFGAGGPWHARNANRIMRWRVGMQAVAILIILIVVAIRQARG